MDKEQILYLITVEDVRNVAQETGIQFHESDIAQIQEQIDNVIDSSWFDAIEAALRTVYS